jgi:hypothetical protein
VSVVKRGDELGLPVTKGVDEFIEGLFFRGGAGDTLEVP